jgi:mono/diheme cytochrome c family protein
MKYSLFALAFLVLSLPGQAEDFHANRFIAQACSGCHGSNIYTRPNRRVKNLAQLGAQVRRCDANLGTGLFDDDIDAVIQYLNATYYHF